MASLWNVQCSAIILKRKRKLIALILLSYRCIVTINILVNAFSIVFVGVLCLSLFCYVLHCVHSSFAIILKRKRKLVALIVLSYI